MIFDCLFLNDKMPLYLVLGWLEVKEKAMDWLQIFVNLVLTGILLYVFQRVIDERSAKRLERFRTELQSNAFEKEAKFSKLHDKRAEVIQEIYQKIVGAIQALVVLKNRVETTKPKPKEVQDSAKELDEIIFGLISYFNQNQLYLPEALYVKVNLLTLYFVDVKQNVLSFHENTDSASTVESQDEMWKDLAEFSTVMVDKIGPLFKEIERDFRQLLGS
jgi:hypothetical protein